MVAIITVNPVIAMACAFANTLMSGYSVYSDVVEVGNKRAEWLAGVNTFEAIATAKMQLAVDSVLLLLNVGATATVVKSSMGNPLLSAEFHRELLKKNLDSQVLNTKTKAYVTDLLKDQTTGEAKNFAGVLIIGNTQHFLTGKEVEHISQASTEIILSFRKKGIFTYKDSANASCSFARAN